MHNQQNRLVPIIQPCIGETYRAAVETYRAELLNFNRAISLLIEIGFTHNQQVQAKKHVQHIQISSSFR